MLSRPIPLSTGCLCALALLGAQGCRRDQPEAGVGAPPGQVNTEPSASVHRNGVVTGPGLGTTSGNSTRPQDVIGGVPHNSAAGGGDGSPASGIGTHDAREDRGTGAGEMPHNAR